MKKYKSYINKLITRSYIKDENIQNDKNIIWKFKYKTNIDTVYYCEIPISNKKYLYLLLTKKKLYGDNFNIYMETFITTKAKVMYQNINEKPHGLSSDYNYKPLNTIYLTQYPELVKLYSIIKYNNIINKTIGKQEFINDLIKWTKDDLITWYKYVGHTHNQYKCYDIKSKDINLYFLLKQNMLIIYYSNRKIEGFLVNKINLDNDILYNTVKNSNAI